MMSWFLSWEGSFLLTCRFLGILSPRFIATASFTLSMVVIGLNLKEPKSSFSGSLALQFITLTSVWFFNVLMWGALSNTSACCTASWTRSRSVDVNLKPRGEIYLIFSWPPMPLYSSCKVTGLSTTILSKQAVSTVTKSTYLFYKLTNPLSIILWIHLIFLYTKEGSSKMYLITYLYVTLSHIWL